MLTFVYRPICYFFMMHTQDVIARVEGHPRLLSCILLSILKVTLINRRDGFVKLGWQQRVLNDIGPGLLAFVTPIPLPPLPSATCLSFSAFLCVRGERGMVTNHLTAEKFGPLQIIQYSLAGRLPLMLYVLPTI
jgi:hypothetical protein